MRLVLLVFPFGYLFGRWVDGLDLVHGICRDAGMYHLLTLLRAMTDQSQDCGIRYKRPSPTSDTITQQSEFDGSSRLCSRGELRAYSLTKRAC